MRQVLFERSGLVPGRHTLKLTKRSGTYTTLDYIEIDYLQVTGTPVKVNNTDSRLVTTGVWGTSSGRGHGDYQDDMGYTRRNGDSISYTFDGASVVRYVAPKSSDHGNVEVFIDNVSQGTFSTYASSRKVQQNIFEKSGLSSGSHTLKLVKRSGNYMSLDYIETVPTDTTAPTLTIDAPSAHNGAAFTATFTFSEAVSGFDAVADITVTGGSAAAPTAVTGANITAGTEPPRVCRRLIFLRGLADE